MNRRRIFDVVMIGLFGLACSVSGGSAQQKTLKEQLIGTWNLVSAEAVEPNGNKLPLVRGGSLKGLQIFTAGGKVSFQIIGDHPMVASKDLLKMTPDELKTTAESILSYFGTYTVNESEKSYTIQIEASSFENQTAAPAKRMVEFTGDQMTVTNPGRLAGGHTTIVWKRAN
jgi:Lipocalin-like domain